MCKYAIILEGDYPPVCKYTNELCTLCILGNSKTYKEAEESEQSR